jgi:hypothetical protein
MSKLKDLNRKLRSSKVKPKRSKQEAKIILSSKLKDLNRKLKSSKVKTKRSKQETKII